MSEPTLVERLRHLNPWKEMDWPERCREAAARIAELENQLEGAEQRGALLLEVIAERDEIESANTALVAERDRWHSDAIASIQRYGQQSDELLALTAERDRLKSALKPFADEADRYEPDEGDDDMDAWDTRSTIGQLRAARSALSPVEGG